MAVYRPDPDLKFLQYCENDDLDLLVSILTVDPSDKKPRRAEELTTCDEYKRHYPDHKRYWQKIAAELQTYGANTLITKAFRWGQGVTYREVLIDACENKKVNFNKKADISTIEMALLMKMLETSLSSMTQEQLNTFAKEMKMSLVNPTPQMILLATQSAIKMSGFAAYTFASSSLAFLLRELGMKAPFLVYQGMSRLISTIAGPIGWGISAAWIASDIAAPAYRVTVPACVIVAYLRQKHLNGSV